jgi:hypothetical protein
MSSLDRITCLFQVRWTVSMTDPSASLGNQAALQHAGDLDGQALESRSHHGSGTNPLSTTESDGIKPLQQQQQAMCQVRLSLLLSIANINLGLVLILMQEGLF